MLFAADWKLKCRLSWEKECSYEYKVYTMPSANAGRRVPTPINLAKKISASVFFGRSLIISTCRCVLQSVSLHITLCQCRAALLHSLCYTVHQSCVSKYIVDRVNGILCAVRFASSAKLPVRAADRGECEMPNVLQVTEQGISDRPGHAIGLYMLTFPTKVVLHGAFRFDTVSGRSACLCSSRINSEMSIICGSAGHRKMNCLS